MARAEGEHGGWSERACCSLAVENGNLKHVAEATPECQWNGQLEAEFGAPSVLGNGSHLALGPRRLVSRPPPSAHRTRRPGRVLGLS